MMKARRQSKSCPEHGLESHHSHSAFLHTFSVTKANLRKGYQFDGWKDDQGGASFAGPDRVPRRVLAFRRIDDANLDASGDSLLALAGGHGQRHGTRCDGLVRTTEGCIANGAGNG